MLVIGSRSALLPQVLPLFEYYHRHCDKPSPNLDQFSVQLETESNIGIVDLSKNFTVDSFGNVFPAELNAEVTDEACSNFNNSNSITDALYDQLEQVSAHVSPGRQYKSCQEIFDDNTYAESGYYDIYTSNGTVMSVYCALGMQAANCGGGGWTRIAFFNMTDPDNDNCPPSFQTFKYSSIDHNLCRIPEGISYQCISSIYYPGIEYQSVCGRVIGYQYRSPDGFQTGTIDDPYVDGISITFGNPRQHIWTYAGGLEQDGAIYAFAACPCLPQNSVVPPLFVGNDYYCESGLPVGQH